MKRMKRTISVLLLACMLLSLLPPWQITTAAEVTQRYELDTDGIDPGATYLIVNTANAGNANALRFYYSSSWSNDLHNQTLKVKAEDGVTFIETGFTNEDDCQFQFTSSSTGRITHGNYTVDLTRSRYVSGNSGTNLTFTRVGNGQYRIHYTSGRTTYYLRYSNSDWNRSGTSSGVYLFKLTEYAVGYDVTFDGNGYTSGTLPTDAAKLSAGTEYEIPAPKDLRKDIGEDTWLFRCWNTAADGTGTEYNSGDIITITEDLKLYAEWYQQTKFTVSMITYMDGVATDVDKFAGYDRSFYAVLNGGDGTYITLTKRAEGTYSAKVTENGTYTIYAITKDGKYEPVHGHTVVIYNQDGTTECMHYSLTYDTNGGQWAEGEEPAAEKYHFGETVISYDKIPTKKGYRFQGWMDQDGVMRQPGHFITENADRTMVLTAVWEDLIDVTVNVTIDHTYGEGFDQEQRRQDASFTLLRVEDGANLPVAEKVLTSSYDATRNVTTYQVVFADLPKGVYHVSSSKSNYETTITYGDDFTGDQTIDVNLKFAPQNKDLFFDVKVNGKKDLMPKAVNVKISYWGTDDEQVLGWHIISQQLGDNAPVTVTIDENGEGTGYFPVWRYWTDGVHPYFYRVEVTSYVLPDGSIVPATYSQGIYTAGGSHFYEGVVTIVGEGSKPDYPAGSNTDLSGAYFEGEQQMGRPLVTVTVNPYTVTFDAGDGKVNGEDSIVLNNQYRYPALHDYIAVPNAADRVFLGWTDENGNPATNLEGQLLTGNVKYVAKYSENITISGTVSADATYQQDGKPVYINDVDRVDKVWVILQKKVGDVFNDIDSFAVELVYKTNAEGKYTIGEGVYTFEDLPNDGTEYRIYLPVHNYDDTYDNDDNKTFSKDEAVAKVDMFSKEVQVDAHLGFAPEIYQQEIHVDASQINQGLRPTGALVQILYRDMGDVHHYQVISKHTVEPFGIMVDLDGTNAVGSSIYDLWKMHTDGTPYEYQLHISTMYGNAVPGAYDQDGIPYTENSPYTVVYGIANNYLQQDLMKGVVLEATLIPKQYNVHLDLNLEDDLDTPVIGLDDYLVDDPTGAEKYAFKHTWSFAEEFTAYPYREGYVFRGWKDVDTGTTYSGVVPVGDTLASDITLVAQWEEMSGTDFTVRYLELNTNKVLKGATMVSGAVQGEKVKASSYAAQIEGYVYAGALVDDIYLNKTENPEMEVTNNPVKNLLVIYYLPDGSDGYTEQVESNLELDKNAVLENNGTYTITLDTYTKDSPITTLIQQDTPLDIVMVLDQSGSMYTGNALGDLKSATENFINLIANHGRENEVDHRIAIVGYASDQYSGYTNYSYPTAGKDGTQWVNTGVFDSNGVFHIYPVTGFNYTAYTGQITSTGTYYTYADGEYLLLTHHESYRHLITAEEARVAFLGGTTVYGYVEGQFVKLTRNTSGLWLYGDKLLYSNKEFFTYHTNVWTHRHGLERREIHAYGVGDAFHVVGEHEGVYTRTETREADPQKSIYVDALVPVSVGAYGSGAVNPGLLKSTGNIGANGETFVSYGIEMANSIFEANPTDPTEGRIRIMVVFTDGKPGDSSNFDEIESNNALAQSYITTNTYGAKVYTIGLYGDSVVAAESDQDFFMNGLSSNYPDAQKMDDVWLGVNYLPATSGYTLDNGGPYFVSVGGKYYTLERKSVYQNKVYYLHWGYTNESGQFVSIYEGLVADGQPVITNSMVNGHTIYRRYGDGYKPKASDAYYTVAKDHSELVKYFSEVVQSITTTVTKEIELYNDTILRDIMGQGLVLTPGSEITAYRLPGVYDSVTNTVTWAADKEKEQVAYLKIPEHPKDKEVSKEVFDLKDEEGNILKEGVPYISVYNLQSANPTDPNNTEVAYHPHTVDVSGYDFTEWYISDTHTHGYKMIVTITGIEARDDVQWGKSTATNNDQSGLWLPADEHGNRQLLLPFDQPTTIFVERAYVLDYGKEFLLSGWYFDDEIAEDGTTVNEADPVHVDCDITNGMNWFGKPNTANTVDGPYGNTKYGNVRLTEDGQVYYSPTSMNWGGYDQFYVFGNTWRKTVKAQDANENGNLWNKVTVIPANNIYYEDSFITKPSDTQNGIQGFTFDGEWTTVGTDSGNTETPEHLESAPYGDVHGWTDSLGDDYAFTDGSAHGAFPGGYTDEERKNGARAEFTFTGTGVEVYTRTNMEAGSVIAILSRITKGENGTQNVTQYRSLMVDNLSMSGEYYHIPTVSFKDLPYGTYSLQLFAMATNVATGTTRYQYYIDGVRIHNPLGNTTNYQSDIIKDAYGLENNAVFTEIRDILLEYGDFNTGLSDGKDNKMGAVFIDWIQEGQGSGNDSTGTKVPTYELGTFKDYGPKNEVYLSAGQAIVLKVAEGNTYYVGMKSLTGKPVKANLSGLDMDEPTTIELSHTTDMYYQVTPVGGYIVIQNGSTDEALLSLTNLRATNLQKPAANGGVLPVSAQEAVEVVSGFAEYLLEKQNEEQMNPQPDEPEEEVPSPEEQAQANQQHAAALFTAVRQWLETT